MKTFRANSSRGITLIELMIAMLIGVFLIGGILQIFLSAKQAYRLQENMSRLQENGRFAIDYLTKGIRMAGFSGCASRTPMNIILKPEYRANLPALGTAIYGIDNVGSTICNNSSSVYYQCIVGTDIVNFQSSGSCGGKVSQVENSSAQLKIAYPNDCNLEDGDVAIAANCSSATAFGVTNVNNPGGGGSGKQTVVHSQTLNVMLNNANTDLVGEYANCSPSHPNGGGISKLCAVYSEGDTELFVSKSMSYFIRLNTANIPSLYRRNPAKVGTDAEELIEGIEDMQVLYGLDTDVPKDYVPNYYVPASWAAGDTMWQNVISARVNLLAVSIDDALTDTPQPYPNIATIDPDDTITPTDHRIRRVFSSTVVLRNRLP